MTDMAASFDHIYNGDCSRCFLHGSAKNVCVGGRGATKNIRLLIVGEAPGPEEDKKNKPFVGPAGRKLDEYLRKVGVDLKTVRYENVVRCHPKNSDGKTRPPTKSEIAPCVDYLYNVLCEISAAQKDLPVIVALGNTALEALIGRRAPVTKNSGAPFPLVTFKGKWIETVDEEKVVHETRKEWPGLPDYTVVGVIHPAAVLRGSMQYEQPILTALTYAHKTATGKASDYWEGYRWIDSITEFAEWVDDVLEEYEKGTIKEIAFDFETTGLDWFRKEEQIVALSYCAHPGKAIVVPYFHHESPWFTKDQKDSMALRSLKAHHRRLSSTIPFTGWNLGFDLNWSISKFGHSFTIEWDGQLAHSWAIGERASSHDLDSVAQEELHFFGHGIGVDKKNMYDVPAHGPFGLVRYAGGDTDASLQLCRDLREKMHKARMEDEFRYMMLRGIPHITRMERNGVKINTQTTKILAKRLPVEMEKYHDMVSSTKWGKGLTAALRTRKNWNGKLSPLDFNLASVDVTLRDLLYRRMRLPVLKTSHKQDISLTPRKHVSEDSKAISAFLSFLQSQNKKTRSGRQMKEICAGLNTPKLEKLINRWKSGDAPLSEQEEEIWEFLDNPSVVVFNDNIFSEKDQHKKTKKVIALASTDKEVLPALIEYCEKRQWTKKRDVLLNIQKWRYVKDEYTRYVKPFVPDESGVAPRVVDGFCHPSYNMTGTVTGRFSSWFHGFPKDSETNRQFVSRWDGGVLVMADMAQSEMRVLASMTGDKNLIRTIKSGVDLHTAFAARAFHGLEVVSPKDAHRAKEIVSKEEREIAKRANFGVLFGLSASGLARHVGISTEEAQIIIGAYYERHPSVREWIKGMWTFAHEHGFTYPSPFGRIRFVPGVQKAREGSHEWIESYNSIISSISSDLTYMALVRMSEYIQDNRMRSCVIKFTHDAIGLDIHPGEIWTAILALKWCMEDWNNEKHDFLKVPMVADFNIGQNFGAMCGLTWGKKENDELLQESEDPFSKPSSNAIRVTGKIPDVARLEIELRKDGWFISHEEPSEDGRVMKDFSCIPEKDSLDAKLDKQPELF